MSIITCTGSLALCVCVCVCVPLVCVCVCGPVYTVSLYHASVSLYTVCMNNGRVVH